MISFYPNNMKAGTSQHSPGAVLFNSYRRGYALGSKEADMLIRYCLGIVHHMEETTNPQRLEKAREIIIANGHRAPSIIPMLLAVQNQQQSKQHLDQVVSLFEEIVVQHQDA